MVPRRMTNPTPEEIRTYWDGKAARLWTDPSATMKDVILRTMEIEAIANRLRAEDDLLDIGCGNAFESIEFAKRCRSVLAVDFSDRMVDAARAAVSEGGQDNIEVAQGSALEIGDRHRDRFTAVSSVRCLINQASREDQYRAIDQFARALRPHGRLFLLEGVAEAFASMNAARERVGLSPIKLDWHNRLLLREELEDHLSKEFIMLERVDFGDYYFLSRIVHPLLVAPEEPRFDARINEIAREIWRSGVARGTFEDMSTLTLYVCGRK